MSTDNTKIQRSNSQRKRDEAASFNRQYAKTKTPEYKAKLIAKGKREQARINQLFLAAAAVKGGI